MGSLQAKMAKAAILELETLKPEELTAEWNRLYELRRGKPEKEKAAILLQMSRIERLKEQIMRRIYKM